MESTVFNKVTLLAVTGLNPQVVTETLYGIMREGLEWPTHIKIITTELGSEQARLRLLVDKQITKFCDDYSLVTPSFTNDDILIAPNAQGTPVNDARSLDDQEALADFITATVAELANDENSMIHASIAGGRKTMTFLLGYAMTIFARPQDRLSHVLVSEEYESCRDFFYPTPYSKSIEGKNNRVFDAQKAQVTLAEIPFVSQRILLNKEMLSDFETFGYNHLIQQVQYTLLPNTNRVAFHYDKKQPTVVINGTTIDFSGEKLEFAYFAMCYRPRDPDQGIDYVERPTDELGEATVTKHFLTELAYLLGVEYGSMSEQELFERLVDEDILKERTATSLVNQGGRVSSSFFDTRGQNLAKKLLKHYPKAFVEFIMPALVYNKDGKKLKRGERRAQNAFYGTWLDESQITFSAPKR